MATKIILVNDIDSNNVVGTLDVTDNIPFPITYAISDIKDLGSKTSSASKTVTLPGTPNNNIVFSNLFDVNVDDSSLTYNVRKKQKCVIIEDGQVVFDNAYIQLISVIKRQNIILNEEYIEYDVLIKSSLSDYFQKIYNRKVNELDFSEFNHEYTLANITGSTTYDLSRGYQYVFGRPEGVVQVSGLDVQQYTLASISPELYTKSIMDVIHKEIGYSYQFEEGFGVLSNPEVGYERLINVERAKPENLLNLFNEDNMVKFISKKNDLYYLDNIIVFNNYEIDNVMTSNEVEFDPSNSFDYPTGTMTTPFSILELSNSLDVNFNSSFQCIVKNFQNFDLYVKDTTTFTIRLVMYTGIGGSPNQVASTLLFEQVIPSGTLIPGSFIPGSFGIDLFSLDIWSAVSPAIFHQLTGQINYTPVVPSSNGEYSFKYELNFSVPLVFVNEYNNQDPSYQCEFSFNKQFKALSNSSINQITLNSKSESEYSIKYGGTTIPLGGIYPMNAVAPDKTIKEYLMGLINIYNLNMIVDDNSKIIKYFRRNYFYDEGPILNWTNKLNRNLEQKIEFLSLLSDKNITLTYKQDNDEYNQQYKKATGKIYNQLKVILDTEWLINSRTIELPFSPTPFIPLSYGNANYLIPSFKLNEDMNSRILFCNQTEILKIGIVLYGTKSIPPGLVVSFYGLTAVNQLGLLSNDLIITIPPNNFTKIQTTNLGFGVNDYEYYTSFNFQVLPIKNNTLYDINWARTFDQINNSRMMTAYFNLNNIDMSDKDLMRSKIEINNSWWVINRIIDYDVTSKAPTQVELIECEKQMII